tara:strand:- start:62 stop:199 length:138 start_codon:yes stop_codon:yes gene_type:complete
MACRGSGNCSRCFVSLNPMGMQVSKKPRQIVIIAFLAADFGLSIN